MMSFRWTISAATLACLAAVAGCTSAASGPSTGAPTGASGGASTSAALSPGQKATGTPIKVGYLNLQGGPTLSAPGFTEGAELAVSYVNGYLNGFGGHPVQLIKCYTDGTPASTTACANRLVDDKVPLVIQGVDTDTTSDTILARAGIPYVLADGVGPADLNTPGVFSLTSQIISGLGGMAKYAQASGWKKVALLPLSTPNISQFFQRFTGPVYGKAGVQYQVTDVAPGTPDLTPQLSAAMSGHSNAIMFYGDVNTCTSFLKAVAALGVTTPAFLVGGCANKTVLTSVPATALQNTYLLSPVDLSDTGADAQTFDTLLRQQDPGADPHSIQIRIGYLPVVTLARMLSGFTGQPTAENLTNAIRSAKNVPLPFGRGAAATCDGTVIPQLPSACSAAAVLMKVQGTDTYTFASTFNVAALLTP